MSDQDNKNIYNVSSKNQSGGITAGVVNFEKIQRRLDDNVRNALLSLDKNKSIKVHSSVEDPESFNFATEIFEFLKNNLYDTGTEIYRSVFIPELKGVNIVSHPDNAINEIEVGMFG